jgi:hypothetical protein
MPHVRLEQRDGGYAVVWLQREPVNTMDLTFWRELAAALQQAEADPSVRGLIFASGLKRNVFTAGNDIKELYAPLTSLARRAAARATCGPGLGAGRCARRARPAGGLPFAWPAWTNPGSAAGRERRARACRLRATPASGAGTASSGWSRTSSWRGCTARRWSPSRPFVAPARPAGAACRCAATCALCRKARATSV